MQATRIQQKPIVPARYRHAEVVAHALAQSLLGGSTQGQRQVFAQWQQGFKGFICLHGVFPSSIMAIFEGVSIAELEKNQNAAETKSSTETAGMEKMMITGRFNAKTIAIWLKMPLAYLKELNPNMDQQLSAGKAYTLVLPAKEAKIFEAHKNQILQASIQSLYLDND
jgi:hypothetical protein